MTAPKRTLAAATAAGAAIVTAVLLLPPNREGSPSTSAVPTSTRPAGASRRLGGEPEYPKQNSTAAGAGIATPTASEKGDGNTSSAPQRVEPSVPESVHLMAAAADRVSTARDSRSVQLGPSAASDGRNGPPPNLPPYYAIVSTMPVRAYPDDLIAEDTDGRYMLVPRKQRIPLPTGWHIIASTDFARDMADAISRGSVARSEPGTYLTLPNRQATYRVWFPNQQPIERTCAGCWVPMPPDPAWYIVEIPATNERWVWAHKAVTVTSPPPSAYNVMTTTYPQRIQPSDMICRFTWADGSLHYMLVRRGEYYPTACQEIP